MKKKYYFWSNYLQNYSPQCRLIHIHRCSATVSEGDDDFEVDICGCFVSNQKIHSLAVNVSMSCAL